MALVRKNAAILVRDSDAEAQLMETACRLMEDEGRRAEMEKNIAQLALRDAAMTIAKEIYRITE